MRTRMAVVTAVLMMLGAALAHGEDQPHNGYWWAEHSQEFKLGFVSGYTIAMVSAQGEAALVCIAEKSGGTIPARGPDPSVLN